MSIPQDISDAIEKAKNQVTLAQQEVVRLSSLRTGLEKEIRAKQVEHDELVEKCCILEERAKTVKAQLAGFNQQITDLEARTIKVEASERDLSEKLKQVRELLK